MPLLVHIANEKDAASIERNGIRPGKGCSGIFFMPVVQSHFISHQWIRELRRSGARSMVGVYFKLSSEEQVFAGHYNKQHEKLPLGRAIQRLNEREDPLGFQMIVERKIEPKEIVRVRAVPQGIGWRYKPHSNGKELTCGCPMCIPIGSIKSRAQRLRLEPAAERMPFAQVLQGLSETDDPDRVYELLWHIRKKRRTIDPSFLERWLMCSDTQVTEQIVSALANIKHPRVKGMLETLSMSADEDTATSARVVLLKRYGVSIALGGDSTETRSLFLS